MTHQAGSGAVGSTFTLALAGVALRAFRRFAAALKNRGAVRDLHQLDDRALRDIGLTRADVAAALDLPLHADPSLHLVEVAGHGRGAVRHAEMLATVVTPVRLDRVRRPDAAMNAAAA